MSKEALELALEALKIARDQIVDPEYAPIGWSVSRLDEVLSIGKQALEQPVQPVAWMDASGDIYKHELWPDWNPPHTPLYTALPAQEIVCSTGLCHYKPAAQPAVALTKEQVKDLCKSAGYGMTSMQARADFINGIRHAEAAHGIKENT